MATCKKCKCDPADCGCADTAIPVAAPCGQGTVDCPTPEPCGETFSAECIVYTGDTIVDVDIKKGDRVDDIIQRLVQLIINPGCMNPAATCQSITDIHSTFIGPSIINIAWLASPNATSYTLQYRDASDPGNPWYARPSVGPTVLTDSVGGLTSGVEYNFRVVTTCAVGSCTSLVISVTTIS